MLKIKMLKTKKRFMLPALLVLGYSAIAISANTAIGANGPVDLSGDWLIDSSVGGEIPIQVHCTLVQNAGTLSGSCTPVMENPEASELTGTVNGTTAEWAYGVVFNGNPGTVTFTASSFSDTSIEGELSLSGTEAPFSASRE